MSDAPTPSTQVTPITAPRVRYLKLGEGGEWAQQCLREDTLRIGFYTDRYFELCLQADWHTYGQALLKGEGKTTSTVTRFVGEVRAVYEDQGEILWITFENQRLYWTRIDPSVTPWLPGDEGGGSLRKVVGWRSQDTNGAELLMVGLSGNLTKTAAFRGTSCDVADRDYVLRRINGQRLPEVDEAVRLSQALAEVIVKLLRRLTWKDFELLVDLVFTHSGWRRVSASGKTQKTVDMELVLPTTGERAFIQVKSQTNQAQFETYRECFAEIDYHKMFYVFHTGSVVNTDRRIIVLGPEAFATRVLEAGLLFWLTQKVA